MKLTSTTGFHFQQWLLGRHDSPAYLFNEIGTTDSMVYGTGSAQLYVMSMLALVDIAIEKHLLSSLVSLPLDGMTELIEHVSKGDWHASKTRLEQVSNYWLKKSQGYSQQFTKSITGSTLDKPGAVDAKTPNKLKKDISKGQHEVSKVEGDPLVGGFYKRFGESPFGMKDVVTDRDTYFGQHGNKGRAQTTHGRDMKPSDLIYDTMIRRSCKFLLYDAIGNKKRVVYLLDDLDLTKVAYLSSKSVGKIPASARIVGGPSDGKVPVCTTEIREIFRTWDYMEKHLKFFMDFEECPPPWDARHGQQKAWAAYAAHRAQQLLDQPAAQLSTADREQLRDCVALHGTNAQAAIANFHAARPSRYTKGASLHVVTKAPETA